MPFFHVGQRLVYYAHVPKCGGSSIANYIRDRFGALAFHDNAYSAQAVAARWTASSPQHVDAATLERLIPLSFFSAMFAIVRHPVGRAVSSYHFQREVEKSIPDGTGFSEWLTGLAAQHAANPFAYDNHTRPMSDIVPDGATVFHIEHGLDALVPWFDDLEGAARGARAILRDNARGAFTKEKSAQVEPTEEDLQIIADLYGADFNRFGYTLGDKMPDANAPILSNTTRAERDRALAAAAHPVARLKRKVRNKLRRL